MNFDEFVAELEVAGEGEDAARLRMGEASALAQREWGYGALKDAAKLTQRIAYKTLAERARMVNYYQQLLPGQKLEPGDSVARDLMIEFPTLSWTMLRVAKGLDKSNPWVALDALRVAVEHSHSDPQFKLYVSKEKARNGHKNKKFVIPERAGWRTEIVRVE